MDSESPDFDAQLDLLVDVVVDYAIYMLDPAGVVLSWDAGAGRLMGYQREEIIGQHFALLHRLRTGWRRCQSRLWKPREGRFCRRGMARPQATVAAFGRRWSSTQSAIRKES